MFNYSLRLSLDIYNQSKHKQNKSKEKDYTSDSKKDQKNKRTKIWCCLGCDFDGVLEGFRLDFEEDEETSQKLLQTARVVYITIYERVYLTRPRPTRPMQERINLTWSKIRWAGNHELNPDKEISDSSRDTHDHK